MDDRLRTLSDSTLAALASAGLTTLEEVASEGLAGLKRLPGIGPTRLGEISLLLKGEGLIKHNAARDAIASILARHIDEATAAQVATIVMRQLKHFGYSSAAERSAQAKKRTIRRRESRQASGMLQPALRPSTNVPSAPSACPAK
jgi:hypothetical protein